MAKYTISGIEHVIKMLNEHPQLMGLGSLAPIRELAGRAQQAVKKSGCACSAAPVYAANRGVFDRALGTMAQGDHLVIKAILKVDEICYYARDHTGNNKLVCV